jgi:hypothetical protein
VLATAGTDVWLCARLATIGEFQLPCKQGPGVPRKVRQAAPAEGQGLVCHAQVTQRVDPGRPRRSCAGNTNSRFISSYFRVFSDIVPTAKCMKCQTRKMTKEKLVFPYVGFEVLTTVIMKSSVFWDKMPCSPMKVNRFGGTYRLHFQY